MKITSINREHSTKDWTAFRTDAKITNEVEKHFLALYAERPESGGIKVEVHDQFVLIQVVGETLPPGFTEFVSRVLTEAQNVVEHKKDVERQKERLEDSQKAQSLKLIAE